ncbi:prolyl 4-hydroxylase 1-like isoform X1 [Coffea arabica]|uniref:Prolyl 4-hydroxylase 1-like isoform X1 n=1 Tax=Coffea arabica TaxID=13443 RepID=A0A6P6WXE3_COFAR|nr:prolyl 4-hydroxylase 1-like isoform X1 [Coffea arabica]
MASAMKIVFGLLTFVTAGMIIDSSKLSGQFFRSCGMKFLTGSLVRNTGALLQLSFIRKLEDSYGSESSFRRTLGGRNSGSGQLGRGYSHWAYDKEAVTLRIGYVKPEIVSWSPRIILLHSFLSPEECDYLRAIALPRLQISTVVDAKTGKGIKSNVRTSSGMFLSHEERSFPMIQAIEKRMSVYSQVPVENGELIQVLRYEKNQFYKPHHDYFSDTFNLKRGGQRVATMLMYLSDNVEGGETYFPMAGTGECSCGGKMVKGLCIKPAKGDAVLFWSMGLDGESDPNSIHGGCEVLGGEKWSATKWMREKVAN